MGWGRAAADVAREIAGRGGGESGTVATWATVAGVAGCRGPVESVADRVGSSARASEVSEACRKQGAVVCVV